MSKKSNKVKFGLKNCHYAKATFDEDGSVTYAKPVRIPGAVSLSMDANGEIEPFYADNIAYYVVNNNSGYEGDLEIALIPESFLTDIMHEELDGNGVLAENANVELEHFAFLFEFDGDQRHIRHVLYNCVASRPSIEGETNEDSKEVKTDTLNLQSTPLANGYVKAKTGTNTTDDVYNKASASSAGKFSSVVSSASPTLFSASSCVSAPASLSLSLTGSSGLSTASSTFRVFLIGFLRGCGAAEPFFSDTAGAF